MMACRKGKLYFLVVFGSGTRFRKAWALNPDGMFKWGIYREQNTGYFEHL